MALKYVNLIIESFAALTKINRDELGSNYLLSYQLNIDNFIFFKCFYKWGNLFLPHTCYQEYIIHLVWSIHIAGHDASFPALLMFEIGIIIEE